jgi:hypothetical protein
MRDVTASDDWPASTVELQTRECERLGVEPAVPPPGSYCVVTPGALDGHAMDCVRYPVKDEGSGWWFITDQWDGRTDMARPIHLRHVVEARPGIARYLALPPGYVVSVDPVDNAVRVSFDPAIAIDEAV